MEALKIYEDIKHPPHDLSALQAEHSPFLFSHLVHGKVSNPDIPLVPPYVHQSLLISHSQLYPTANDEIFHL